MTANRTLLASFLLICASCAGMQHEPALLFEGTGEHSFPITSDVPMAQVYFDQGLALSYGFNHDEAVRSFAEVTHLDPSCAMGWWGQAYALGPNMNQPVAEEPAHQAAAAIAKAMDLRSDASELEQDLIEALAVRLAEPAFEDRDIVDGAYSGAMRVLWNKYPDNPDVGFLYADALINETPWDLWSADFEPNVNTLEAVEVLDRVMELELQHPGANHFYIHAWEPSGQAHRAEAAADRLGKITPGLGHMVHMPAHIYVLVGRYEESVRCNDEGARLDREYFELAGPQGVYHGYQAHNTHFRVWSAMYMGDYEEALRACDVLMDDMPESMQSDPYSAEFLGMDQKVHLRFGNWEAALDTPKPGEDQPFAVAMWHYARGLAFANTQRFDAARLESLAFEDVAESLQDGDMEFFKRVEQVMTIAREMLAGEIAYLSGDHELGYKHLRLSVEAEDALDYSEPSPWMVPTRHSLGALLLEQGHSVEAEDVYRQDLRKHPGNIWSLQGLTESLERNGKTEEAVALRAQFEAARARASVDVKASCYCRTVEG